MTVKKAPFVQRGFFYAFSRWLAAQSKDYFYSFLLFVMYIT